MGEILGVADVDELEAWGLRLVSVAVDELKGQKVVEDVLELMGVVVGLLGGV